jgi:capsular exopolysaccharide synthesis family protein
LSVSADPTSDILTITITDRDRAKAVQVVNELGEQFIRYRRQLDTAVIQHALDGVRTRIAAIEAPLQGKKNTTVTVRQQLQVLLAKQQDLQNLKALQGGNLLIVDQAKSARQVQPLTTRNAALGLALGLLIGVAAAFVLNAFDPLLRSGDEASELLGVSLLGRLPAPPRRLRSSRRPILLNVDAAEYGEPYRKLRTNLDFANLTVAARSMIITSAVEREGKSTTVANMAIAFARAGRRVVLVDLDLRRPVIASLFGLELRPGITDVVAGGASIDEALFEVEASGAADSLSPPGGGELLVMGAGSSTPDPAGFVSSAALGELLSRLQDRADVVLIDSPPLLPVSDALSTSAYVEGLVLIVKAGAVRRDMLSEVRRLLENAPATVLGFVLTNAQQDPSYGYDQYYYYRGYAGKKRAVKT